MSTQLHALSVSEAVTHRRSIRAYQNEPIPPADLDAILAETRLAPSAWNLQPWRFVVVRDPATKARLAEAAYGQKQVTSAPAVIVIWTDMADTLAHLDEVVRPGATPEQAAGFRTMVEGAFDKQPEADRETWGSAQGYIALGYLLLAAESRGYATSPMAGFEPEKVKALLGLPVNARVPAIVSIGRPAEVGLPHYRHPLERIRRVV